MLLKGLSGTIPHLLILISAWLILFCRAEKWQDGLKGMYGLPYVLISHGHDIPWVHPRQMFLFHLGTYLWIRSVCRDSPVNFIQTGMMKDNIDRFMGEKHPRNNILIPNGVDTSKFYPDYSKRHRFVKNCFCRPPGDSERPL